MVEAWGAASQAGVQPGDGIVAVNGFPVTSLADMRSCLVFKPVELSIKRNDKIIDVLVSPQVPPDPRTPPSALQCPEYPSGRPGTQPVPSPQ